MGLGPEKASSLPGQDPVEVAVLDGLVVVVLVGVEGRARFAPVVEDSGDFRPVDSGDDVPGREVERRRPRGGVSEGHERLERRERRVRALGVAPEQDDGEDPAEHGGVGVGVGVRAGDEDEGLLGRRGLLSRRVEGAGGGGWREGGREKRRVSAGGEEPPSSPRGREEENPRRTRPVEMWRAREKEKMRFRGRENSTPRILLLLTGSG